MDKINDIKLTLQVSIRDAEHRMLAFADNQNLPVILIRRKDIDKQDFSSMDSSTGLIKRNGEWKL